MFKINQVVYHWVSFQSHDRTDKLQCPHCLKTFSLFSDKGYNSSVASSFVSHLQMHKDKKVVVHIHLPEVLLGHQCCLQHTLRHGLKIIDWHSLEERVPRKFGKSAGDKM